MSNVPLSSAVHHLEEIKQAGLDLPSINQIEVRAIPDPRCTSRLIEPAPQLHPFCQQKPIVQWCRANKVEIQAYCPVLRGKLDDPVIGEIARKVCGCSVAQMSLQISDSDSLYPVAQQRTRSGSIAMVSSARVNVRSYVMLMPF